MGDLLPGVALRFTPGYLISPLRGLRTQNVRKGGHGIITCPLAHEDAAGVGWVAAEEREQQVQSWEAEAIDLRAAAWACAGY